jgi:nicotinamidase-related amidase
MAKDYYPDRVLLYCGSVVKRAQLLSVMAAGLLVCLTFGPVSGQTIVDEWNKVQPPKPPELKPVKIDDPKTTAFLVLDIASRTCNSKVRPRCIASVPKIQAFLSQARAKGLLVVYSLGSTGTSADILKEVAPRDGEPIVQSSVDKFFGTDLDKILKEKGIKTVIVVGTAAHGAVLNTGIQAALRGLRVIVPVDGMSAEDTYFEQYTAYHFAHAPGVSNRATLTKFDMIQF